MGTTILHLAYRSQGTVKTEGPFAAGLLPILFHCVDDQGRPMLGPPKQGPDTEQFRRTAYRDIPAVVEEMRQYWMPTRFKTRS